VRIVRWLAAHDLGTPEARAAATDRRALNRLVRAAFRHAVRYYVQLARAPIVDKAYLDRWLVVETPEILNAAIGTDGEPKGALFVGNAHGLVRAARARRDCPQRPEGRRALETIADPGPPGVSRSRRASDSGSS
jgi:hypothetical protein